MFVNEDPVRDAALFGEGLLRENFLATEIGIEGKSTPPFCTIELELNKLLFWRGVDKCEVLRCAVGKGGKRAHGGEYDCVW
jgi:hypothetical protein